MRNDKRDNEHRIASKTGMMLSPKGVNEYSVLGGTTG